jgi:asparagine synthase (glutamine-hydrolysing)
MPGIVGLITKQPRARAERQLQQMVAFLKHESFYSSGTWIDEELGAYIGWVSRNDAETLVKNPAGDIIVVFSGEEYSGDQRPHAHISNSNGQASNGNGNGNGNGFHRAGRHYLGERCESDLSFPASLNGRFHGISIDRRRGLCVLFNDRYGMHRLYCYETSDGFYFAAEAKAILGVRPETRKLNSRSLGEFLACACALENRSLFENVELLPPGSAWRFRNGTLKEKQSYFHPQEWEQLPQLDSEQYYVQLRDTFARILPRYFSGPQKIGISLTGGLDSRMIMAWQKNQAGSLPCYSFGGSYRDCQDVVIARRVAEACGQDHQVIPVGKDFLSHFARYAERTVFLTDGAVHVSHSPDLYVNERARQIAPVRMTGNYGGEVLRRVRAFKPGSSADGLYQPEMTPALQQAKATYDETVRTHPLSLAVFRQAPWHHHGLLSLEQTQLALRSPFLDNELVKLVFQAPDSACRDNDVSLRLIQDGNSALSDIRTDRGLAGNHNRLLSAWNQAFYEFTYKAEYAYDYGMPQWVAKVDHAFAPLHFERLFLGRQKFYHFRVWYRDQLSQYVRDVLLDSKSLSRPYLNKQRVDAIVAGHLKGDQNFTSEIHNLLSLEHIHRLFLDSSCMSLS